jgi:inosine-uridine nucleoside N-ribohydrolase
VLVIVTLLLAAKASVARAKARVILDTDMVVLYDDGVALMMLANHPDIDLLGVTIVSGNTWVADGTAFTLGQLELVNRPDVPVAMGVRFPLRPSRYENIQLERKMFGYSSNYIGCFSAPPPASYIDAYRAEFAGTPTIKPVDDRAVTFLIDCTNLAIAIRISPDIIPLIKSVVYMGGAFDVPGNTTPAAEFNFWFDPDAARICLRAPFPDQLIVPLDVCEKYRFNKNIFDRITAPDTPIARMFKKKYGPRFDQDSAYTRLVWDTIAAGVVIEPTLITTQQIRSVDINSDYGLDYGRSLSYKIQGPPGTQKARILFAIDEKRFWNLMINTLKN